MKKFTLAIVAFAAMILASCGGKTQQAEAEVDTTKTFEQAQIEAAIKMHLDSLANDIDTKEFAALNEAIKNGKITLSEEQKMVKPEYLIPASTGNELTTAAQKYAAIAIFDMDKAVAGLYDMDTEAYDAMIAQLTADINDPAIKKADETEGTIAEKHKVLYEEMDKEGRINFYWVATGAATVENLFIMSQNVDKFLNDYTDEQVSNITFRLICILDALDRLSVYDPQLPGLCEALEPLKAINATTVADLKKQLEETKADLSAARLALLK